MWESLKPVFEWAGSLWIGKAIAATIWAFPLIETIHILAMTVMFGAMSLIDLRLVGLGMRKQPVSILTKNLEPYMTWGMLTMLGTGFLLYSSEAMKCFVNDGFRFKMEALLPAVIFQFTLFRWVSRQDDSSRSPILAGLVALLSFGLWMAVGVGGRAIGFV
jgi:Family of unknown function (DUF6644)